MWPIACDISFFKVSSNFIVSFEMMGEETGIQHRPVNAGVKIQT